MAWYSEEWFQVVGFVVGVIGAVAGTLGLLVGLLNLWVTLSSDDKYPNINKICNYLPIAEFFAWLLDQLPDGISNIFTTLRVKIEVISIRRRGYMYLKLPETIEENRTLLNDGYDRDDRVGNCVQALLGEFNPLEAKDLSDEYGRVFVDEVQLRSFKYAISGRSDSTRIIRIFISRIARLIADEATVIEDERVEVPWEGLLEPVYKSASVYGDPKA